MPKLPDDIYSVFLSANTRRPFFAYIDVDEVILETPKGERLVLTRKHLGEMLTYMDSVKENLEGNMT